MHHMVTTLQPGPFVDSLCKKPTTNLDELRQRAAKYTQLEELREHKSRVRVEDSSDKGKEKEKERPSRPAIGRGDKHTKIRGPWFMRYTPSEC